MAVLVAAPVAQVTGSIIEESSRGSPVVERLEASFPLVDYDNDVHAGRYLDDDGNRLFYKCHVIPLDKCCGLVTAIGYIDYRVAGCNAVATLY